MAKNHSRNPSTNTPPPPPNPNPPPQKQQPQPSTYPLTHISSWKHSLSYPSTPQTRLTLTFNPSLAQYSISSSTSSGTRTLLAFAIEDVKWIEGGDQSLMRKCFMGDDVVEIVFAEGNGTAVWTAEIQRVAKFKMVEWDAKRRVHLAWKGEGGRGKVRG